MIIQLTDPQRNVLAPAAERDDRCIFPVTALLKGGAVGNVLRSLLKRVLVEEVAASDADTVWRCSDDGKPLTLRATDLGVRAVLGDDADESIGQARESGDEIAPLVDQKRKPRGAVQDALLELLRRPEGATIAEMVAVTDWQSHSVRGALSGLISKKLGHKVESVKEDGRGRVYRIAA